MFLTKASKISATIGVFALLITLFLTTDAAAQRYCPCSGYVSTVRVRHAPARHIAYRRSVHRNYRVVAVRRSYVPMTRVAGYVYDRDDVYTAPVTTRVVVTEPVYTRATVGYYDPERIGRGWGRRDGFKDGYKAALKGRVYNPENNGDYHDANNGYKRRFGSKYLYKGAYRDGYVHGYESGWRSVNDPAVTYGAVRY